MTKMDDITKVKQRFSIIGNSPALIAAIERAVKVAPIDLSVLVTGESGSGKEFFPKIIHAYGARKHKKYIAVNCGAIPEGTIDSELFGHEKGSFTGAISSRKGYFEEADGGTIFLDEVAELPLTTQARLLRVLETGEFLKVGSSIVQKTDIRVVAATNVNLLKAVEKGKFREDLYYRLSTVVINVPSLHDRGDDIELLARKFASDFSEKYLTAPITFSEDAKRAMLLYRWPGNVRQLKNIVEQLALFDAGTEVNRRTLIEALPLDYSGASSLMTKPAEKSYENEREMLWQLVYAMRNDIAELRARIDGKNPLHDKHTAAQSLIKYEPEAQYVPPVDFTSTRADDSDIEDVVAVPTLEDSERDAVAAALRRNNGNKKKAAEQLNISQRTLYRKIHEYGLDLSEGTTAENSES
ncbi:MAG: sigma-54-dependent Fis family transcriptional regulator [Bacteroides sp.]|nr:sigma-54-dependent Fis family transcriptional regulator [Bacteroides sp.]